jgi:hypothetical protein
MDKCLSYWKLEIVKWFYLSWHLCERDMATLYDLSSKASKGSFVTSNRRKFSVWKQSIEKIKSIVVIEYLQDKK